MITKEIQTCCLTLEGFWSILEELISYAENNYDNSDKIIYRCTFQQKHICFTHVKLCPGAEFERGVVKLQRKVVNTLYESKGIARQCLQTKIADVNANANVVDSGDNGNKNQRGFIIERHQRNHNKRKMNVQNARNSVYGNCDINLVVLHRLKSCGLVLNTFSLMKEIEWCNQ